MPTCVTARHCPPPCAVVPVYHCAALVSTIEGNAVHKREIFDTNVRGTINILQAAVRHGIDKLVVSGSLSATGYEPDRSSHRGHAVLSF